MIFKWLVQAPDSQVMGVRYEYEKDRLTVGGYARDAGVMESLLREVLEVKTTPRQKVEQNKIRLTVAWRGYGGLAGLKRRLENRPGWLTGPVRSLGRLMR